MTGSGMEHDVLEHDVRRTTEAGFAAHLTKPFQFAALKAAIRKLMVPDRRASA